MYYKVVRERDGHYRSAIVNGKACLNYRIGEKTYGLEGTPVLVFKDIGDALRFVRYRSKLQILEGKAHRPRRQNNVGLLGTTRGLMRFWAQSALGKVLYINRLTAPRGTYATDWFEPTDVVQ